MPGVDLVINTFERTYRRVLAPGFFRRVENDNRYTFARKVALINNVEDIEDAVSRAEELRERGEIDAFYRVAEYLDLALERTGLRRRHLGRVPHYSDCALVAVTLPGSPWLLYWDAEVELRGAENWIDPAIELLTTDPRILVANPCWNDEELERETLETRGDFALGYGFSDQVFLARRNDLAAPIYRCLCPASWRYPMAHITAIFEARVDAYMRRHRRMRATHRHVAYAHPPGTTTRRDVQGWREHLRKWRNRTVVRWLRRRASSHPCWSIYGRAVRSR